MTVCPPLSSNKCSLSLQHSCEAFSIININKNTGEQIAGWIALWLRWSQPRSSLLHILHVSKYYLHCDSDNKMLTMKHCQSAELFLLSNHHKRAVCHCCLQGGGNQVSIFQGQCYTYHGLFGQVTRFPKSTARQCTQFSYRFILVKYHSKPVWPILWKIMIAYISTTLPLMGSHIS